MIEHYARVEGDSVNIYVPEDQSDMDRFWDWWQANNGYALACDTETTGLEIFSEDFRVRAVQLGNSNIAWVLNPELVGDFEWLNQARGLIFHNASYDYLALLQGLGVRLDWNKIGDTKILSQLIDSRAAREGGVGHSLQELTAKVIDKTVAEEIKGSMAAMSKETGLKKGEMFAKIEFTNPTYLTYAGMDVILTARLYPKLLSLVPSSAEGLYRRELQIAKICAEMENNGFLLDVEYAEGLSERLIEEEEVAKAKAAEFGIDKVGSTAQVAEALIANGVRLNELTASGNYKLDKTVMEPLVKQGNPIAIAVTEAKRASKWRKSWVQKFLDQRDKNNRCHASIQPMQARTGRMSITGIPAQTLPSSDRTIRDCFIAEDGFEVISVDYQAQELRVLAALSGDENMQRAFREGADLHQMTADASGVDREVGKTVNFAYVYGSGPRNIAETCGISLAKAKEVIAGFERAYPGVKALSDKLTREAKRKKYITTEFGRRLYVDSDRAYSALNYAIQSTSRDITAEALLKLDAAGFTPYLRLPVHDEIVAVAPTQKAEAAAAKIAELMTVTFKGVVIEAEPDVYGRSWGDGYAD